MSTTHTTNLATLTATGDWRELASREGDGLSVSLVWSKAADQVKVILADSKFDETFEFTVASAHALTAFQHPFAYMPSQSFGSVEVERESLNLHPQA